MRILGFSFIKQYEQSWDFLYPNIARVNLTLTFLAKNKIMKAWFVEWI